MFEDILSSISDFSPLWIYLSLLFFSYIENIFPPSPSDLVVVVGGSLVGAGAISFVPTLLITSFGSIAGFMTLYFLGSQLDRKLISSGKLKFISLEALQKAEAWFNKYGYWVILINRFLPGTRSVISFFAGVSELKIKRTLILAGVSSIAWNFIIIYLGILFGDNISMVDKYLSMYSNIILIVSGIVIIVFAARYFIKKKKKS